MTTKKLNRNVPNAFSDGNQFMLRLTYVSRAADSLDSKQLTEILKQARINNTEKGITGILVFNKNYFLQCVEGSRIAINELLNALVADNRHHDLQIIEAREVNERIWGEWSMDYVSPNPSNRSLFLKYSSSQDFNPYLMSARSTEWLLHALSEAQHQRKSAPSKSSGILAKLKIA